MYGMQDFTVRMDAAEAISMVVMQAKRLYDEGHASIYLSPGEKVLLRLHRGYSMASALPPKFSQQYAGPCLQLSDVSVDYIAYDLELPPHWAVHSVFSVAFLEKYPQERISQHTRLHKAKSSDYIHAASQTPFCDPSLTTLVHYLLTANSKNLK